MKANDSCKDANFCLDLQDEMNAYLLTELGFCGCGPKHNGLPFVYKFICLQQEITYKNFHEKMDEIKRLIEANWMDVVWIICYLLNNKRILSHDGFAINGLVNNVDFLSVLTSYYNQHCNKGA